MDVVSIVLIAVGLAMDAFAVSIVSGISLKNPRTSQAAVFGLFFGMFQFIMPIIGWYMGSYFAEYIEMYAHWVAFLLLAVIGVKMILESLKNDGETEPKQESSIMNLQNLIILAVATSIDALAVGISFAAMNTNIWFAAIIIGIVAFLFSYCGVLLGKKLGVLVGKKMETIGGVILIIIGIKIIFENIF